jgi:ornithine cyclodeaminase/alanine dehydrogenase-like protein (mu-crystallin family)
MKAAEQRLQLHRTVGELKTAVRQKLDVKANAREYIIPASFGLAVLGLAAGYVLTGVAYD